MKVIFGIVIGVMLVEQVKGLLCGGCQLAVGGLGTVLSWMIPNYVAIEVLDAICMRRYDSEKLCKRVGQELAPLAISNFLHNHLNPHKRCSSLCNNTIFIPYSPESQLTRILTQPHSQSPHNLSLSSPLLSTTNHSLPTTSTNTNNTLNILQLSDVHLDTGYVENSSIFCEYPICCHGENGFPDNAGARAKGYGSKNCDTPRKLLESFLGFVEREEKEGIDVVMVTGDVSAHNEWEKTANTITQTQAQFSQKLAQHFPTSILLTTPGNNDYLPDHQFNPNPHPQLLTITNIKQGQQLLTFVSINTIAYDELNLYLLGDQSYAIFQLLLLEQVLAVYQNVYLFGHIPPTFGGGAGEYGRVYRALVKRYAGKIKGQFYGHTHSDQISINTNPLNQQQATGFAFICPSLSPLYIGSSRARVYRVSVEGVHDYTQYVLKDLDSPIAAWKKQYSFRYKYSLSSPSTPPAITLSQMTAIKQQVFTNKIEQRKYIRTTGLNEQLASKSYCNILDSPTARDRCFNRPPALNTRIISLLHFLTGKWGFYPSQIK